MSFGMNRSSHSAALLPKCSAPAPAGPRAAEMSDDQLMQLLHEGEPSAFAQLMRRHQRRVTYIATRYLNSHHCAVDVVQNIFFELYAARHRYQACGKFSAYLRQIVLNQCRMTKRSLRLREHKVAQANLPAPAVPDPFAGQTIAVALAKLSDKLRVVVVLRYAEELSLAEIAADLELPIGTVKRRLFDALLRMRQSISDAQ